MDPKLIPTPPEALAVALTGRYSIERQLGAGGMATVYLARDIRHGRDVALKVLAPGLAMTIGADRFRREIRLAAGLHHPNILSVLDSGEDGGFFWYTMPFVDGTSLQQHIRTSGRLTLTEALQYALEAADALGYAHHKGVIHRDIKPANLLLANGHLFVADFGIATPAEGETGDKLTSTGFVVGTPDYMSPEQASGAVHVDGRTDQFSLACVVYEMLAGESPFNGPTPQAAVARRFSGAAESLSTRRTDVPAQLDTTLARALALDPDDRFGSMAAFQSALRAAAGLGSSVGITAIGTDSRRLRHLGLAVLAGVLLLAAGIFADRGVRRGGNGSTGDDLRLVVLPFDHFGPDSLAYFAGGITEAISQGLAQLPRLTVIDVRAAQDYAGTSKPARQIGRELGVSHLVRGSVRWDLNPGRPATMRVTPMLVSTDDGRTAWAGDPIVSSRGDVFELQAAISSSVAAGLASFAEVGQSRVSMPASTTNAAAYDLYLRGRAAVEEARRSNFSSADDYRRVITYFRQAIALDPQFSGAQAQLALILMGIAPTYGDTAGYAEGVARADTAWRADPWAAEATEAKADALVYAGHFAESERLLIEGIARHPRSVDLLRSLGVLRQWVGRDEEALKLFDRALEVDPRSMHLLGFAGTSARTLRRFDLAAQYADRMMQADPADWIAYLTRILIEAFGNGDGEAVGVVLREAETNVGSLPVAAYGVAARLAGETSARVAALRANETFVSGPIDSIAFFEAKFWAVVSNRSETLAMAFADSMATIAAHLPASIKILPLRIQALHAAARQDRARARLALTALRDLETPGSLRLLPEERAWVLYRIGAADSAVATLRQGLRGPGPLTRAYLRIDAPLAPLRAHPAMQALLADNSMP